MAEHHNRPMALPLAPFFTSSHDPLTKAVEKLTDKTIIARELYNIINKKEDTMAELPIPSPVSATEESQAPRTRDVAVNSRRDVTILPPLQINGLRSTISIIRAGIAEVRELSAGVNDMSAGLISDLQDLKSEIAKARSDLRFEAETLTNGNGND